GGANALLGGVGEGLAVSPDGSGVVFEVTDELGYSGPRLPPEEKGFFFVRADGSGGPLKIGSPSRVPPYDTKGVSISYVLAVPSVVFSPDGERIAFTDLGPGPTGEVAPQIVTIDLAAGRWTHGTR